jgi:glycine oxidase
VAGGMLAPASEAMEGEEALLQLGMASVERWSGFVDELVTSAGVDAGYTGHGTLVVARDTDDVAQLGVLLDLQRRLGIAAERVSSREARRIEPALGPAVRGAIWLAGDHQVDNRMLLDALRRAVAGAGVELRAEAAERVVSWGGAHRVVSAGGEVLEPDEVVVAAGAASGRAPTLVVDGAAAGLPVRPVKGQIVRVRATSRAVCPTRTVRGLEVYVVPRAHGEIAIGATSEERGFDTTVTAGAVRDLLDRAWELLPGLAEAEFLEVVAGLRPGTPDNGPLLGRLGDAGPVIATGHHRNGILLAPVTAEAVADLLEGRRPAVDLGPFAPDRFAAAAVAGPVASGVAT